ncbi:MAG: hypothetical protein HY000_37810 [Planctomycetes bacterium]|nr:hypothetical protein [Planctomycetota bacterium]
MKRWDVATGQVKLTLSGQTGHIYSVAFSQDGTLLASAGTDVLVKLWDTTTWQEVRTLKGHTSWTVTMRR